MLTVESFWCDFLKYQLPSKQADNDYLLAYSGGCDSHVLLHLFSELKRLKYINNIRAVHVNHQLQSDSAQWAEHCLQQCANYAIPCEVINVTVDKHSAAGLEAAARKARYTALQEFVTVQTVLLTAQHADDQVETFLLQSLRGGGVKGLASMPMIKTFAEGYLCRPLLHISQTKISEYAVRNKLQWVDDPSNANINFDRNFLRQSIIPLLKQRWPSLNKTFHRLTQHQAEAASLIDDLAAIDFTNVHVDDNRISIEHLNQLSFNRQKNVLRFWIAKQDNLSVPDTTHLMRILNEVVVAAEDSQPEVSWNTTIIRRFKGKLFAEQMPVSKSSTPIEHWQPQRVYALSNPGDKAANARQLEACETLGTGLSIVKLANKTVSIRFREGGEVCCPQGRGPQQHKLKKLFQEWGVPPWQRDTIPLVYVDGVLAQVVGYCVCEPFAAQPSEPGYQIKLT